MNANACAWNPSEVGWYGDSASAWASPGANAWHGQSDAWAPGYGDASWSAGAAGAAWGGESWSWPAGQQGGSGKTPMREIEAENDWGSTFDAEGHVAQIHFTKTYQVLSEVLATNPTAFREAETFLDLGCAPGGFSSRLLDELPNARGYGVTLQREAVGFPVLLSHERFQLQYADIMALRTPTDIAMSDSNGSETGPCLVGAVMADAQDLSRRTGNPSSAGAPQALKAKMRSHPEENQAVGVGAALSVLGIWAMTFQELQLGLGRLASGGTLFFRFGWRGRGASEEPWYNEATHRMIGFLLSHFEEVVPFKSEFSHQADSTFYIIGIGFLREAFVAADLEEKCRQSVGSISICEKVSNLPSCMEFCAAFLTDSARERIAEILDRVGRLRQIGMASRHRVEAAGSKSAEAVLMISPVPFQLTLPKLRERLERYGRISNIRRRSHAIGVGADAVVHFTQPAHAQRALEAIRDLKILGDGVVVRHIGEEKRVRCRLVAS